MSPVSVPVEAVLAVLPVVFLALAASEPSGIARGGFSRLVGVVWTSLPPQPAAIVARAIRAIAAIRRMLVAAGVVCSAGIGCGRIGGGQASVAVWAVVDVLLDQLLARAAADAQVFNSPRQVGSRLARREHFADDDEIGARLAVDVAVARLDRSDDVTLVARRAQAEFLGSTHEAEDYQPSPRASTAIAVGASKLAAKLMRVLIFHGYLLRGTGSNVYNAELAKALVTAGHDVDLVCQERAARELESVDAVGSWDNSGALVVEELARERPAGRGRLAVFVPPIADQLPVYVQDNYEGFTARTFDRFDDEELDFYVSRNVMAVRAVIERARPDFGLANHMVMGPYVLAKAFAGDIPYVAKIHGSAMEYIVRPFPRFLPYAREGVGGAGAVLVGSRHIAERTWDTLQIAGLEAKIFLGPPGVDVESFRPRPRVEARAGLAAVADRIASLARDGYGPEQEQATSGLYERVQMAARASGALGFAEVAAAVAELQTAYSNAGIDPAADSRMRELSLIGDAPMALYVGKLIVSKGVDLLIAAWPLVLERHPGAKLLITGFGAYREGLELLIDSLCSGDLTTARWIAEGGRAFEGGRPAELAILAGFLAGLEGERLGRYMEAARGLRDSVVFVGRLEHDLLSRVTPAADCQIVPSTFPEAFGMVAAEAAACGVPPISAEHSGLAEVTHTLQQNISGLSGTILSFTVNDAAVEQLAARIDRAFALGDDQRTELSSRLVQTARARFSWAGVADDLIAAGTGRAEALRKP